MAPKTEQILNTSFTKQFDTQIGDFGARRHADSNMMIRATQSQVAKTRNPQIIAADKQKWCVGNPPEIPLDATLKILSATNGVARDIMLLLVPRGIFTMWRPWWCCGGVEGDIQGGFWRDSTPTPDWWGWHTCGLWNLHCPEDRRGGMVAYQHLPHLSKMQRQYMQLDYWRWDQHNCDIESMWILWSCLQRSNLNCTRWRKIILF